jgi:hypothetical protein
MPINDDAVIEYVEINGEQVPKIVVPAEITITHTQTGKEYGSAKEADDDVNDRHHRIQDSEATWRGPLRERSTSALQEIITEDLQKVPRCTTPDTEITWRHIVLTTQVLDKHDHRVVHTLTN